MERPQVYVFDYRDYHCIIVSSEHGFWGEASKDGNTIDHLFPEQTLEKEIEELKLTVDAEIERAYEAEDDGNCHICGGCSVCGAYCTADGCYCDDTEPYDLDEDTGSNSND